MNVTVFMFVNILVGIVLLFLLARFAWTMWFSTAFHPVEWTLAVRENKISPVLKKLSRRYPDKTRFFAWWLQVERLEAERIPGDFIDLPADDGGLHGNHQDEEEPGKQVIPEFRVL